MADTNLTFFDKVLAAIAAYSAAPPGCTLTPLTFSILSTETWPTNTSPRTKVISPAVPHNSGELKDFLAFLMVISATLSRETYPDGRLYFIARKLRKNSKRG